MKYICIIYLPTCMAFIYLPIYKVQYKHIYRERERERLKE